MKSKIIAHRGLRSEYPENTKLAIEHALDIDIAGVEFDLELTSDLTLVALHQETLVPFNGKLKLAKRDSKRAWVNQLKKSEILTLDAGSWFDPKFSDIKIPLFNDLKKLAWKSKTALIELKDPYFWENPNVEFENLIVQAADQEFRKLADLRFIVLCFNEIILQKLRILNPLMKLGLNVWTDRVGQIEDLIEFAKSLDIALLQFPDQVLTAQPKIIKLLHESGIAVGSYSVSPAYDDPEHSNWTFANYQPTLKRLVESSVDYIITDFATESLEYLKNDLRNL